MTRPTQPPRPLAKLAGQVRLQTSCVATWTIASLRELSCRGMVISSASNLAPGTALVGTLQVQRGRQTFEFLGEVCPREDVADVDSGGCALAIRFLFLEQSDRERLERLVSAALVNARGNAPAPPLRSGATLRMWSVGPRACDAV